jgi:formate hydrogenlyase subunit 6/NADH:ubiquinone oxidoreductase subunit I
MAANNFVNPVLNKVQAISAFPSLCKVARFQQSECRKCEHICPENAITVAVGPQINGDCSQCGLCLNVCPTEALYSDLDLDQLMDKQMMSLRARKNEFAVTPCVSFHCQEAQAPNAESLGLRCLGNLTENTLLRSMLLGFEEVLLSRGKCSDCRLSQGGKMFDNLLATMQPLTKALGWDDFSLHVLYEPRKLNGGDLNLSRRALFAGLIEKVVSHAAHADHIRDQDATELFDRSAEMKNQKRASPKRETLRTMLREENVAAFADETEALNVPWKKMTVDQGNCIACGICVAVCPTGALVKFQELGQVVRTINYALCSNCLLCQEACPKHVISFTENSSLADVVEDQIVEVARIDITPCVICGEPITPAEGGQICMTCNKRQMSWPVR